MKIETWHAPRIWPNATVIVIGGGPSLKELDLTPIYSKRCIGTNFAFTLGDWVDVCWWGDSVWGEKNQVSLDKFKGLKVNCCTTQINSPGSFRLKRGKMYGIDLRSNYIAWNNNSGASAINLAYHFGAKRVILVGFDMKFVNGKNNWHDLHDNPRGTPRRPWNPYPRFLQGFDVIKIDAEKIGMEILNATPDSELKIFPFVRLKDVF